MGEGAAMIRTKGEAGTGDVVEAVRHARTVLGEIRQLTAMADEELMATPRRSARPMSWSRKPRNWAACRWSTLPLAALPPPLTRR